MTVYAIGDLHLPGGDEKPMEVFGSHWQGHWEKICQDSVSYTHLTLPTKA